ncbi:MAG: DUF6714 family protein [Desulfobulbia bacterium]
MIEEAFPKTPTPEYKLSNAIIDDDYGDTTYAFEEKWETWDQIEDWQVAKCDVLFSFAPPEAAVYYTPRYMNYALDDIDGAVDQETLGYGSGSGDCLAWYLQAAEKSGFKETAFNEEQIQVIELFLKELRNDEEYKVTLDVGNN